MPRPSDVRLLVRIVFDVIADPSNVIEFVGQKRMQQWLLLMPMVVYPLAVFGSIVMITSDQSLVHDMLRSEQQYLESYERASSDLLAQAVEVGLSSFGRIILNAILVSAKSLICLLALFVAQQIAACHLSARSIHGNECLAVLSACASIVVFGEFVNCLTRFVTRRINGTLSLAFFVHPFRPVCFWHYMAQNLDVFIIWYLSISGVLLAKTTKYHSLAMIAIELMIYLVILLVSRWLGLQYAILP